METKHPLRVAELSPLWKIVPPAQYGGTELVVSQITEGLLSLGCDVTLFACGGSKTSGKLVEVIVKPMYELLGGFSWDAVQGYDFLAFNELFSRIHEFDVIHNHMGFHPLAFSKLLPIPMVTTLHSSVPPDFPYLAQAFRNNNFVSISNAQRVLNPGLNYLKTIYHGIDTKSFTPNFDKNHDYFLFIGSLSENKGIDIAVRSCFERKEKLIIAGEIRESDKAFLDREVFPYVDGTTIKYIGEVNHTQKAALYAGAKALLFPIRWNEAFGLVMAESLACGTPVIAYNKGSVSEVITDGETGFIVNNQPELMDRMEKIDQISRKTCRDVAEKRFDVRVMAGEYKKLFTTLVNTHTV